MTTEPTENVIVSTGIRVPISDEAVLDWYYITDDMNPSLRDYAEKLIKERGLTVAGERRVRLPLLREKERLTVALTPKEAVGNVIEDWITDAAIDWWPVTDEVAQQAVDAIPDGWCKWNGQWVQVSEAKAWDDVDGDRLVFVTPRSD